MAFFTPYYKKISYCIRLGTVFSLLSAFSIASIASSNINIKLAELQPLDDFYALSADIDIDLDDAIEEAVNKGVPLNFLIEFQVVSPRKYWFDDEIITATRGVMLSYHALSRQYLVNRGAHQKSFETMDEALQELMVIEDWKVLDKSLVEKNEIYNAALLVRLDQTKLPKAIQVDAIASEKWNLISQKYEWSLKDLSNRDSNNKDFNNKDSSNKELTTKEPIVKEPALKSLKKPVND